MSKSVRALLAETISEMNFPNATHFENECEKFGMMWGCKPNCPIFEPGDCELQEENTKMFEEEGEIIRGRYAFIFDYEWDWMIVYYENGNCEKYFNSAEDDRDNSLDYIPPDRKMDSADGYCLIKNVCKWKIARTSKDKKGEDMVDIKKKL